MEKKGVFQSCGLQKYVLYQAWGVKMSGVKDSFVCKEQEVDPSVEIVKILVSWAKDGQRLTKGHSVVGSS